MRTRRHPRQGEGGWGVGTVGLQRFTLLPLEVFFHVPY
jgi:hypothetical protein